MLLVMEELRGLALAIAYLTLLMLKVRADNIAVESSEFTIPGGDVESDLIFPGKIIGTRKDLMIFTQPKLHKIEFLLSEILSI